MINIKKEIEKRRDSKKIFWRYCVSVKDSLWKITSNTKKVLKGSKIIASKTNLKFVEIEITSFCNLNCINCNRSIRQARTKEYMTTGQIRRFVDESINLNYKWEQIRILGGEPTLHPDFDKVLKILFEYKKIYNDTRIELITNGHGNRVKKIILKLPSWIEVKNSNKASPNQLFINYNDAPIDSKKYKKYDFGKACDLTESCGLGLTRYGYYYCGPGASIDRVFGFDIGIKKLINVTDINLNKQKNILCRYCGRFKKRSFLNKNIFVNEEKMSPTWKIAYEKYKKNKPRLSVY